MLITTDIGGPIMNIIRFIRNSFKNSFYSKMLILYSGITLLAFGVLISMFIYSNLNNQKQQNNKNNWNTLSQFQIYTDQYLLDRIYSVVTESIYSNSQGNKNLLFSDKSYTYNRNDFSQILKVQKELIAICNDIDFIESISIYHKKYDTYISTKSGGFYNITNKRFNYASFIPYHSIDYSLTQQSKQFWIPPTQNSRFYADKDIVSLVQSMPVFVSPKESNILLTINIDLTYVYQDFFSNMPVESDEIMILDSQDNIIYSTDKTHMNENTINSNLLHIVKEQKEGSFSLKLDDIISSITLITSTKSDWKYIYLTESPNLLYSVFSSTGWILTGSLLVSMACLFCIYIISKWLYKPLHRLVSLSKNTATIKENDISVINSAFNNMHSHMDHLQQIIEQNNSLLVSNIANELLDGHVESLASLNERLSIIDRSFVYPTFYLICTKIDETIYKDLTYKEKDYLHISVMDFLDNYYISPSSKEIKAISIFRYSGHFITIINVNQNDSYEESLKPDLLLEKLSEKYGLIFNLAISSPITDFRQFHTQYAETLSFFKYRFMYGNNNIFTKEQIMEYERDAKIRQEDTFKILSNQLKKQNAASIKKEITLLFNQSRTGKLSLLYTYNLSLQLISLISNECTMQNINCESLSHQYLLTSFSKLPDLDKTIEWFCDVVDEFIYQTKQRNTTLEETVIPTIISYIKENINGQLSLNSVAEHFGISTSHLSRLFKEKSGMNFSEYLVNAKLETAANLLVAEKQLKISEITETLGYSNVSYFTKLFKETYGVTPTQYRKLHINP